MFGGTLETELVNSSLEEPMFEENQISPFTKVVLATISIPLLLGGAYVVIDAINCYRSSNCKCISERVKEDPKKQYLQKIYCPNDIVSEEVPFLLPNLEK